MPCHNIKGGRGYRDETASTNPFFCDFDIKNGKRKDEKKKKKGGGNIIYLFLSQRKVKSPLRPRSFVFVSFVRLND